MQLEGKIAIVTGASRGIGREIALGFAAEGADVTLCARDEIRLQQLAKEITQRGRRAVVVKADVTHVADVQTVVDQTLESFGRIDVLCNNAGLDVHGEVDEIDPADWDNVIAVNLRGPFLCSRAVLPHMKNQNYGRIVDVSSGSAVNCSPGMAVYSASKAGLNAFSRTLAAEVREHDILVNAMSPGFLKTDMNPAGTRPPEDAVPTALLLASLPTGGPSGKFYRFMKEVTVIPELSDLDWRN
jgi:3-oxoacyl-[acyl-carrier protein] reductase